MCGHRPLPGPTAIQDLRSQRVVRLVSAELDDLVRRALAPLQSDQFVLSVYFGRNVTARYDRLAGQLFQLFEAPLLRVEFERRNGDWQIRSARPIAASDVPDSHHDFLVEAAAVYFDGGIKRYRRRSSARFDLAILHDPDDPEPPSDTRVLQHFVRAGETLGIASRLITREDAGRLTEFDALFIRETTAVNHHTYRIARRAEAEGLVVIDDPDSILRCTNKVYLAELLQRHGVPAPRTLIVHRDNTGEIVPTLGLPVVLKQPDSAFSRGVVRGETEAELKKTLATLFEQSDLVVAQLSVAEAPPQVVRTAVRAAGLIGDGLYGVDLKQVGRRCCVNEVNDNPSIDAGVEDSVLRGALYGPAARDAVVAARVRRDLRGLRPHLRRPGPRLVEPAERAREPAVRR